MNRKNGFARCDQDRRQRVGGPWSDSRPSNGRCVEALNPTGRCA